LLPIILEIVIFGIFLWVGVGVIIFLDDARFFLPATVLALVVWWFTRSFAFAGLAFVCVAILGIFKKKRTP
jgi:hypothetical protein